jgi:hypothetical protein
MSISLNSQKNNYKDIHQISFEKKFDTEKKSSKEESSLKKSSKNRNTLKKKNSKKDNKTLIKKKIDKEIQWEQIENSEMKKDEQSIDIYSNFLSYKPLNKYSEFKDFRPIKLQSPKYIALRKSRPIAGKIIKWSSLRPISTTSNLASLKQIDSLISSISSVTPLPSNLRIKKEVRRDTKNSRDNKKENSGLEKCIHEFRSRYSRDTDGSLKMKQQKWWSLRRRMDKEFENIHVYRETQEFRVSLYA